MAVLVGIEIDWNVVRGCVVDTESDLTADESDGVIVGYDDQITLQPANRGYIDQSEAIAKLWDLLDVDGPYKLCVAVGVRESGLIATETPTPTTEELASCVGLDLAWRRFDSRLVAYLRHDYLEMITGSLYNAGITANRIELAPESLSRVLTDSFSGKLAVSSGTGWQVQLDEGRLTKADTDLAALANSGARVVTSNSECELTSIRNLEVSPALLAKTQIEPSTILVAAGAALGAADRDSGFLKANVSYMPMAEVEEQSVIELDDQWTEAETVAGLDTHEESESKHRALVELVNSDDESGFSLGSLFSKRKN